MLSEMAGAALRAVAQGLPHFCIVFIATPDFSCSLWREDDDPGHVSMWLPVGHGPGVPALGTATHPGATVPTPPTELRHARKRIQVRKKGDRLPADGGTWVSSGAEQGRYVWRSAAAGPLAARRAHPCRPRGIGIGTGSFGPYPRLRCA
jgi:hypothetical protein